MITVTVKDCNSISQKIYNSIIHQLPFHQLRCSCGHAACLTIHGYYSRSFKMPGGTIEIKICRVKCSECGKTHAILLSSMVPYSQIRLVDQLQIVMALEAGEDPFDVCSSNPSIDEDNVKYVLRSYRRHWRERLRSEWIPFVSLYSLIRHCFSFYSRQFMQIRRTVNSLFKIPT